MFWFKRGLMVLKDLIKKRGIIFLVVLLLFVNTVFSKCDLDRRLILSYDQVRDLVRANYPYADVENCSLCRWPKPGTNQPLVSKAMILSKDEVKQKTV